jgi:hypothetical protein
MRFTRKAGAPADKSPKRLHVEPAELARKLIKEMDDHTVARGDDVWVRNRYIVYLCPVDYQNLAPRAPQITADLTGKLIRHVRDKGYLVQGDLSVEMVLDPELELGYFGILAQRAYPQQSAPAPTPVPAPQGDASVAGAQARPAPDVAAGHPAAGPTPGIAQPEMSASSGAVAGVAGMAGAAAAGPAEEAPFGMNIPPSTEVLGAKQSQDMGLARRVIVITSGDDVREFTQSRVVLGRSKDADLRIDDPNVSRKHAAIYWNDGRLILEDLGSTNGTLVNGYPVTSTVLRPRDLVAIGDSRLTVESK